jgi:hypothetical protein
MSVESTAMNSNRALDSQKKADVLVTYFAGMQGAFKDANVYSSSSEVTSIRQIMLTPRLCG